jgi:hypothetical protein
MNFKSKTQKARPFVVYASDLSTEQVPDAVEISLFSCGSDLVIQRMGVLKLHLEQIDMTK